MIDSLEILLCLWLCWIVAGIISKAMAPRTPTRKKYTWYNEKKPH